MYSTLLLLLLVAFALYYLTSPQLKTQLVSYQAYLAQRPRGFRVAGGLLLALTALAFGWLLGPMTGLITWLVALMSVGGLVVALGPLGYLKVPVVAALYAVGLGLEFLF